MPLYMTQFAYTPEAWAALARNPEDRATAVRELMEATGGRLISFYYSFGEYDGVIISESPDERTVAATLVAAVSAGHIKAIKTTTLLSSEDGMEMLRRARELVFRGPTSTPGEPTPGSEIPPERVVGPEAPSTGEAPLSSSEPPRQPPPQAETEPPPPGPPPDANPPA